MASLFRAHQVSNLEKRNLILTILNSTATKRETKNYFLKYQSNKVPQKAPDSNVKRPLRISIIKIRNLSEISTFTLQKIGITLFKLIKLGVSPLIVLDGFDTISRSKKFAKGNGRRNFHEVNKFLDKQFHKLSRFVENPLVNVSNKSSEEQHLSTQLNTISVRSLFEVDDQGHIDLTFPNILVEYLQQGMVPIIYPFAFFSKDSSLQIIPSNLVVENVAVNLHNYNRASLLQLESDVLSIEKIIYIDQFGGIPSLERKTSSHVLVNLKQEYNSIMQELQTGFLHPVEQRTHTENLKSMHAILSLLPDSVSGILTTPESAAIDDLQLLESSEVAVEDEENETSTNSETLEEPEASEYSDMAESVSVNQHGQEITSFKVRNPIIYNVLTDRPVISPSLPVYLRKTPLLTTTVVRKGMEINYFSSESAESPLRLREMHNNGQIDLGKLKGLIDDSFRRSLDLDHYLKRVESKVAGLIIAGDYEGGAIVTWEYLEQHKRHVAYLDKFAVKRSIQGNFSVADIVFKLMVNEMFDQEIIWRSRRDNPVNKWYDERSHGNVSIGGTNWRCFWVGKDTKEMGQLGAYMEVCKSIEPSWE